MDTRYRLELLGSFALRHPDGRRIALSSRKSVALLALLAMSRSGERQRTWLQARLWGARAPDQARASLRRELSNLRAALGAVGAGAILVSDHARIGLDLARIDVDVRRLERAVANGRADAPANADEFLEGLDLPGEEGFEDWLRDQRALVAELRERASRQHWARTTIDPAPGDLPASTRPTIAVVRFANLGTREDEIIAEGLTDEVALELSRHSTLFVVRADRVGERPDDEVAATCRKLGVRYLLAGLVQCSGDRLRVNLRLLDGAVGEQVWSDRFDGTLADVFALQERIAVTVAPYVDATIEQAERRHARNRPVDRGDACQLYWRANALFREFQRDPVIEAAALAEEVLAIEPDNAWAAALAAFCHALCAAFDWVEDRPAAVARALALYERSMAAGGDDPFVLGYAAGTLLACGGDLVIADRLVERALAIHPNVASTLFWGGWIDLAAGRPDRASDRFRLAIQLNPLSAVRAHSLTGIGIALLAQGRHAEASGVLTDAVQHLPRHPPTLAATALSLMAAGRMDEARSLARRLDDVGGTAAVSLILRDPAALAAIDELRG